MKKRYVADPGFIARLAEVIDLYPTVRAAALAAGKSQDMIFGYRRGQNEPPFQAVARLATGVGVSLDWLATGTGEMRSGPTTASEPPAAATDLTLRLTLADILDDELRQRIAAVIADALAKRLFP